MLIRRTLCLLVALGSVLGCADEKEPVGGKADELDPIVAEVRERCSDFAFRLCASAADCCESTMGAFSPEECATSFISDFCVPASQVVGEHRATYDPDAEEACLGAWRRAHETCVPDWEEIVAIRRDVWASCKMVRGTTPVGGGCATASTCQQPDGPATARCVPDPIVRDTTTCQVLEILGEGATCPYPDGEVSVCDVGLYCTTTQRDMPGTCEPVVPEAGACDSAVPLNPVCGLGSYCGLDDDLCHRAANFGGPSCTLSGECVSFKCEMVSGTCTDAPSTAADLLPAGSAIAVKNRAFPPGPLELPPLPRAPELVWRVPGSKSITNRALVLAALAQGTTRLEGVLASDDTAHMRAALEALGIGVRDAGPSAVEVTGGRDKLRAPAGPLFVGNSGTAVRFLAALAALVPGDVRLEGDAAMARRPIEDLVGGLRELGVRVDCPTGCPPLTVHGGKLPGGTVTMSGERSSQYFSALMLAGVAAEGDIAIRVAGRLVSRPYVEITRRMVADFGGRVDLDGEGFVVRAGAYTGRRYVVEPDASSASYPFALATATGGNITVPDLAPGALQGDYGFVEVLRHVGADVSSTPESTTVRGGSRSGIDVDMHDISDTVMTLAAIAPLAIGPTRITNVANIRIKETDRLAAVVAELERLGQGVKHGDDFLVIEPAPLRHALVQSYGDHRMAMSFAVLGMASGSVAIEDPSCVAKTYPTFWDDVAACYRASGAPVPWH